MDDADYAAEREEIELERARKAMTGFTGMKPTGECYNCGDRCEGCFCGAECREDYELRLKAKERNGK